MNNLELYERVRKVPEEAKKIISAGRVKGFTDINPMWRIKTLTEQFGPCGVGWYYDVNKEWIERCGDEFCAFVDISLYIKFSGEWSKPIRGTGGSRFATKEKSGIYVSDECYKMATTDAISVACKCLGIGADVYWDRDFTKYSQSQKEDKMANTKSANTEEKSQNVHTQAKKNTITYICKKHKIEPEMIAAMNGIRWDQITDSQLDSMLAALKKKFGDE